MSKSMIIKDAVFYLNAYKEDHLTCLVEGEKPSEDWCKTCPYKPCELVQVGDLVDRLTLLLMEIEKDEQR